jgi:hypothetical protein
MIGQGLTSLLAVSLVIVACVAGPSMAQPTALDFSDSPGDVVRDNSADRMLPDQTLPDEMSSDATLPDETFQDELLPDNVLPDQNPANDGL